MFGFDAAFVVANDHVQDPVQAVFHRPMISDHGSERLRQQDQRGDVEARLALDLVADFTLALDHDDAFQSRPIVPLLQPADIVDRGIGSGFDAA